MDTTILNIFSCRCIHLFRSLRHCTSCHHPSLFWRTQVRCHEDGLHSMMWKNLAFLHHSIWTLRLSLGRLNRARPLARSYDQRGNCSWLVFLAWRVSRHSSYRLRTLCLWWCHYLWRCNSAPRNESSQLNSLRRNSHNLFIIAPFLIESGSNSIHFSSIYFLLMQLLSLKLHTSIVADRCFYCIQVKELEYGGQINQQ